MVSVPNKAAIGIEFKVSIGIRYGGTPFRSYQCTIGKSYGRTIIEGYACICSKIPVVCLTLRQGISQKQTQSDGEEMIFDDEVQEVLKYIIDVDWIYAVAFLNR